MIKNKLPLFFISGLCIVFIYLIPLLVLNASTLYVPVFDFLDISIPLNKILIENRMVYARSEEIVPNMMNGLPRLSYGSEFNFLLILMQWMTPFNAWRVQEALTHIVSYIGMFLFLFETIAKYDHKLKKTIIYGIITFASTLYALLPLHPAVGISLAFLPMYVYLFMIINQRKDRWYHWLLLCVIPIFTDFILVYSFFILFAFLSIIVIFYKNKSFPKKLGIAVLLVFGIYLILNYRILFSLYDPIFISHRIEFLRRQISFQSALHAAHGFFIFGQTHTMSLQGPYILFSVLLGLFLSIFRKRFNLYVEMILISIFLYILIFVPVQGILFHFKFLAMVVLLFAVFFFLTNRRYKLFYAFMIALVLGSLWYGMWFYEGWKSLFGILSILRTYDISRLSFLVIPIWYASFAFSLIIIAQKMPRFAYLFVITVFLLQVSLSFNSRLFFKADDTNPSFNAYYDETLFRQIKSDLGKDISSFRIVSIGIPPAVSLYNRFYTLDGYSTNYPIEYKYKFRKLIEPSLIKYKSINSFFDNWGSKCYILPGVLGIETYQKNKHIDRLDLNITVFNKMGGKYILSAYFIEQHGKELNLLKKYGEDNSHYWNLWLYEVKSPIQGISAISKE